MRIVVIGTGYVGLVTGVCFAELGLQVTCVDKDAEKIARLKSGLCPIYEPGLPELMKKNAPRLVYTHDLAEAFREGPDAVFIAVGTPTDDRNGGADLSHVFAAAESFAPLLKEDAIIVTKSTVPVGTGAKLRAILANARPKLKFHIVSNPEFLRQGYAVHDFLHPDRLIVGVESDTAREFMQKLYLPLCVQHSPGARHVLFTDIQTAELIKYAANAFLATKISFINEMADICESVGANISEVAEGMGLDPRIGPLYLQPGPGFGGSCFPKDTRALAHIAQEAGSKSKLVSAVVAFNDARKQNMAQKIIAAFDSDVKNKTIAVLGLAFKSGTDDMRESAALTILPALLKAGATVRAYDPEAMANAKKLLPAVQFSKDVRVCCENADGVVILTEWPEFAGLSLAMLKSWLAQPVVVDLRNLFSLEAMQAAGFTYHSIGRSKVDNR